MRFLASFFVLIFQFYFSWAGAQTYPKPPKLFLILVIDQFRADYLTRYKERFLPAVQKNGKLGGFNHLISKGAYYPFAEYSIQQSMTGPGHSIILSGSLPYLNGIPLNVWRDSESGEEVYCVSDPSKTIVSSSGVKVSTRGMSPKNFIGTTFGDELKNTFSDSKVVAIALKDRASILLGGKRADLSLWLDAVSLSWVSSSYYLPDQKLPVWVDELNTRILKSKGSAYHWKSQTPRGAFEVHSTVGAKDILWLPYGLEVTQAAVEKAVEAFHLGTHKAPDVLAISFSSHDYLGHHFGPDSRELEEMTVAEDRMLADLFEKIQKKIPGGMKNIVTVLTADHGIPPLVETLSKNKIESGKLVPEAMIQDLETALTAKFGSGQWVKGQQEFHFFLNHKAVSEKHLAMADVEQEAKRVLSRRPEVSFVFTRSEFEQRKIPPGILEKQILHTYFAGRSGDVVMIPKPYYILGTDYPIEHLTGYAYDRMVPLIISGPGIRAGVYSRHADIAEIAPTLAFLAGILPPALSEMSPLVEAVEVQKH